MIGGSLRRLHFEKWGGFLSRTGNRLEHLGTKRLRSAESGPKGRMGEASNKGFGWLY